jgi:hypothetical protein
MRDVAQLLVAVNAYTAQEQHAIAMRGSCAYDRLLDRRFDPATTADDAIQIDLALLPYERPKLKQIEVTDHRPPRTPEQIAAEFDAIVGEVISSRTDASAARDLLGDVRVLARARLEKSH